MASDRWILNGHRFRTAAEYEAALRDDVKIKEIKQKIDLKDAKSVSKLYGELQSGQIVFETVLGQEFDDEIFELHRMAQKKDNDLTQNNKNKVKSEKNNKTIALEDFDETMQKQIIAELRKKERIRKIVLTGCCLIAVVCILYFGVYQYMSARTQSDVAQWAELIKDEPYIPSSSEDDKFYASLIEQENGEPQVLYKYEDLYNQNKSLIGWVKIADTIIDYPVMQTVNNEYYLDHNFNQEYDKNGSIFMDAACSAYPRSMNLIIYGHHMKSGSMFGGLQKYQSESYFKEHRYIQFDTIYEQGTYEVMFVFRDKVYSQEDVNFKYYEFVDANSEEEFYSYMQEMAANSFYDTGVIAVYGDRLLTLSTCDYQQDNGRFVVVAREVTE